jgi:methyl-accepting chemotaxis protein
MLASFQLSQYMTEITQSIKTQEIEIASSNAKIIDNWINSKTLHLVELNKAHPEFSEMDMKKTMNTLKIVNQVEQEVETSLVADKDGNCMIDNYTSRPNMADQAHFIMAKETKKPAISDIMESEKSGSRIIAIAVPILDKAGNFLGIIQSNVLVKALESNIGTVKIAESGFAYLMSNTGNIIFHREWQRTGKNYKQFTTDENTINIFDQNVLVNDSDFIQYDEDDGTKMVGAYATVPTTGWKVIVTAPSNEVYQHAEKAKLISIFLIIIATVLVAVISVIVANRISKPIRIAAGHLNTLAKADFTKDLPNSLMKRQDEIGDLMKSVNVMSKSIRNVINGVINETNNVKENILISSDNLTELSDRIAEVSNTTEEISAVTEETAASTQQMNATSVEIENAVRSIAEKAKNGSDVANEISTRAQDLKESATISQQTTNNIRNDIDAEMKKALEQSKAVKNIDVLTESILQITEQTNLLSLNAAIEAARAGEAGKGFAVVANEIRKLAEDSKSTVNKIQNVTMEVIKAVEELASSSEKVLDFIDTKVISDYKTMVGIGEQYYNDAGAFQKLTTDFSTTSDELLTSIQSMVRAINEVTISNSEEAEKTQNISQKALDVMEKANRVLELMNATKQSSESLTESVSRFKV